MNRIRRPITAIAVFGLVGLAGVWAGRTVLAPPDDPLAGTSSQLTYTVVEGQVGRSMTFAAVAEWTLTPLARNAAFGTITSIPHISGDPVEVGDELYRVDLRPVVAGVGPVPSFRDLRLNDQGEDVAQLQAFLKTLDFYSADPTGRFDQATRTAVRAWQQGLGVTVDGVVRASDIVYVPSLPARLTVDPQYSVGTRVSGGEQLIALLPEHPRFWVPLQTSQRALIPLSTNATVTHAGGTWPAIISQAIEKVEFGELQLELTAPDGGPVCGTDCAEAVGLTDRNNFATELVAVPHTEGPVVPVTAIGTDASAQAFVTTVDGTRIPIQVLASSAGIAVVEGIEVGTVILLPYGTQEQ